MDFRQGSLTVEQVKPFRLLALSGVAFVAQAELVFEIRRAGIVRVALKAHVGPQPGPCRCEHE